MKKKRTMLRFPRGSMAKILLRMKLLTVLMLAVFAVSAANSYSQATKFSLRLNDATVREVFQQIEENSEFILLYNEKLVNVDRKVSVDVKNETVESVLNQVFEGTTNAYRIYDRQIVILRDENAEVPSILKGKITDAETSLSQGKEISGKVTDTQGLPLPGVSVVVKGTTQGTVTNADGEFSLSIPEGAEVLQFSFVGMKMQEVAIAGRSTFAVVMEEDFVGIEEVVAVGYGTMKKSDLTGSVVSANIEAFNESPNLNIMQSLQGSVPGIQIGQVNQTGQEPSIQIRGTNTLGGNKSPLLVVDEIVYNGRIGDLNPSDIKSIEVLKDASSKAIYGSQAANGVILITTKSGDLSRKPIFTYSGSVSFQKPTVNARLLNREENLERIKGIYYTRAYLSPDFTTPNPEFNWRNHTELVPNLLEGIDNGTDFDWYDALTSPAQIQDHLLSVSGGTEKTNYYISGGYTGHDGFVINDQYERYTARVNIRNVITDWLTVGINTFGSFTDFSGIGPGAFHATSPFVTPYEENGELSIYPKGASTTHLNPFLNIQADHKNLGNQISGIFFGEVKVPKVDGLKYRFNFNKSLSWSENFTGNLYGAGLSGSVSKIHASRGEETLDNILSYEKQLSDHRISATLVYGYRKAKYNSTNASGTNVPNLSLSYNSLQQAIIQEISSAGWNEASLYQMARMNYIYKDRYLVTGTIRRDGFSGFASNNKFALFPSAGLGWVLSNEPFFNIEQVDYLKIRASYGQNGNQTSRYSSLARVAATDDHKYVFGDGGSSSMGQAMSSLANSDLSWEKTTGMNYGIDFGFFDNRITGNIEYYKTTTTDLLWDMVIPQVTGFSSIKTNIGEVANSGFELYVQATPVQSENFSWDFGINFSTNKNQIVSLLGYDHDDDGMEDDLVASGLFIGKSIGTIYHYEIDGIWQINDDIPDGYNPGNYRIVDQNDDGKITADDDRVFLGRSEPAFMAGFQNNLNYKNFTLRFFINTIQGGKDGYLGGQFENTGNSTGNFANANYFTFYDHWSVTNPNGKYSVWYHSPQINPTKYCSRSFVRLQDISLAYRLNQSFLHDIGIHGVKLYISGKNLLTFTKWDGWDPETNQGISSSYYPVMKSLNLGVDIEF